MQWCSRAWQCAITVHVAGKPSLNRCIPQILQDFFVSEVKQEVDLTREGDMSEHSKQVQVDDDASLTAEPLWLPLPWGMSHRPHPPLSLGSLQSLGCFL